jgi:xylose isomerase
MDIFARALMTAHKILDQGEYTALIKERYATFDNGKGRQFERGRLRLEALRKLAHQNGEPVMISGRQEYFENLISGYV